MGRICAFERAIRFIARTSISSSIALEIGRILIHPAMGETKSMTFRERA
jgi:hypothetical protein